MGERFLLIKPSSFGDIVHLFPALTLLRKHFPDAKADFLVNPEFAPLLDFSPFPIRRRILFERRELGSWKTFLPAFQRLFRELRRERYDLIFDFQGLFRSAFCAGIARAPVKAGFAAPREKAARLFYHRTVELPRLHAVERNVRFLTEFFSWENESVPVPELPVSSHGEEELKKFSLPPEYFVLLPGTRWKSKQFPPALFQEIIREIRKKQPDAAFVAAGSAAEGKAAAAIGEKLILLTGKTDIQTLFELFRHAKGVIGNDSGPLHAACAVGVPVFGFYGPTDPGLTGPWGEKAFTFSAGISCNGCLKRSCPRGDLLCQKLDAAAIAEAVIRNTGENPS